MIGSHSNDSGFTLVEILAVLVIMTLLVTVAVPLYQDYNEDARASEIVMRFDALRTNVASDTRGGIVEQCSDLTATLNNANLGEDYADLSLGFEAVGNAGYRPVMLVCARDDAQGAAAVAVANAAFENLSQAHRVEAGAVVSEIMVSFALPLTPDGQAACRVPPSNTPASNCGGGSQPAPSQPPAQTAAVTAQNPAPTSPTDVAPQGPQPVVQTASPQPQSVLNALGAVPAAQQQTVADLINQMDQDSSVVDALGRALASGTPLGMPGPDAASSQQCGISFAGSDLYLGDCSTDFPGLCPRDGSGDCTIAQICPVSCGLSAPATPEIAAAMREKHYASVRALCYGSTISNTFQPDNQYCQELSRLDAARAAGN